MVQMISQNSVWLFLVQSVLLGFEKKKILEILTLSIWLLSVVTLEQADLGSHYSIKYSSHFARERCEFYSDEDEEL